MDIEEKTFDDTVEEIIELLENRQYRSAREEILKNNGVDAAEILEEIIEELGIKIAIVIFRMLPKDMSVEVFSYLTIDDQKDIINGITDVELSYIIDELDFDDKIDVLEELPANIVDKILEKSTKAERKLINTFLNYPDDCAGSLMTPEYISLQGSMTVREALKHIKNEGMDSETVYTCYVKSGGRKLEGIVSLRTLVISDDDALISDLMHTDFVDVNVYDDQEEVSDAFMKYGFLAIPVVDNEGMFVGIITIDDAIDVLTDESTEDMQKMAAILPADEATTYFGTSVWTHAKQRIPWLLILMLSATFTGMVTTHYEEAFVSLPLLVSFMPMLMDTAGNCGNQISTLMVRGLALGEVEPADFLKVLAKELRVSAIVGAVLGLVNGLRIYLMYTFIFAGQYDNVMGYAIVVSVSLFFSVILAKLVGGMLPLAAKKLGADPAIMATPFITTIVDACSLILYFQIAQIVFRNMM